MNSLIFLLIGIAIGWLIELLLDYFFWRKRSICAESVSELCRLETENGRLLTENNQINSQLLRQNDELDTLRRQLSVLQNQSSHGANTPNMFAFISETNHRLEAELREMRSRLYDCLNTKSQGNTASDFKQTLAAILAITQGQKQGNISVQVGREYEASFVDRERNAGQFASHSPSSAGSAQEQELFDLIQALLNQSSQGNIDTSILNIEQLQTYQETEGALHKLHIEMEMLAHKIDELWRSKSSNLDDSGRKRYREGFQTAVHNILDQLQTTTTQLAVTQKRVITERNQMWSTWTAPQNNDETICTREDCATNKKALIQSQTEVELLQIKNKALQLQLESAQNSSGSPNIEMLHNVEHQLQEKILEHQQLKNDLEQVEKQIQISKGAHEVQMKFWQEAAELSQISLNKQEARFDMEREEWQRLREADRDQCLHQLEIEREQLQTTLVQTQNHFQSLFQQRVIRIKKIFRSLITLTEQIEEVSEEHEAVLAARTAWQSELSNAFNKLMTEIEQVDKQLENFSLSSIMQKDIVWSGSSIYFKRESR